MLGEHRTRACFFRARGRPPGRQEGATRPSHGGPGAGASRRPPGHAAAPGHRATHWPRTHPPTEGQPTGTGGPPSRFWLRASPTSPADRGLSERAANGPCRTHFFPRLFCSPPRVPRSSQICNIGSSMNRSTLSCCPSWFQHSGCAIFALVRG